MFGQSNKTSPKRRLTGPYRSVVVALCAAALVAGAGTAALALVFAWPYTLDAAVLLAIIGGMLFGVAAAKMRESALSRKRIEIRPAQVIACAGLVLVGFDVLHKTVRTNASLVVAIAAAVGGVLAAGVAALAAHYFGTADVAQLPEAPALQRGARVAAWLFVLIAGAAGALRLNQRVVAWSLHGITLAVVTLACADLLLARRDEGTFPIDLRVLAALGRRANLFSSLLDAAQQELGIDLRSTWALTVARRFAQPLVLALCVLGWLSTSITVVATDQVGTVERFGTVVDGPALSPGIHVHWPWPIDRVHTIDAMKIRALAVGHEGTQTGPEDVLWARQHTPNEYTLLLGDGHDLITVDAQIQYRIRDARAYFYGVQNPDDALKAIGFRAVMRATVNRTLDEALSENVAALTESIRQDVQANADEIGLGVDVVGFTIGGMHPPVDVALDYQQVVSAELAKVTTIVEAQAERNKSVPAADAAALVETSTAHADGAAAIAKAASDAWSFRTLESQYRAAPDEYRFRRRLEALEQTLGSRHFTIVDARIMRDGGELWLTQ
jgi:regulator of protease activity HflC (stomatin/prohibitin superfamily)